MQVPGLGEDARLWRACIGKGPGLAGCLGRSAVGEYCHKDELSLGKLSNQWLSDHDPMLPQLREAGALTPEIERTTQEITQVLSEYGQEVGDEIRRVGHMGPYQKQFSERAIREDERWEQIRALRGRRWLIFMIFGASPEV